MSESVREVPSWWAQREPAESATASRLRSLGSRLEALKPALPPVPSAEALKALGATPGKATAGVLTPKSGRVCVTGASGFIALHLTQQLCEAGYTVVAAVRAPPCEGSPLALLVGRYVSLSVVDGCDLLRPGSYDAAIAGCVGVFHTASPFFPARDSEAGFDELVVPAVRGTRNVLEACAKAR